jgi:uncharacterized protein YndB with AHSA1/START domain
MADILHKVGIQASADAVYRALTTREGLRAWWTADTHGDSEVGSVLQFRFGSLGGFDMRVLQLKPARQVLWQVIEGPEEWLGTKIRWELKQEEDYTSVLFAHEDWKDAGDFMHHCSTKWATFLMSLKWSVERREGRPWPHDVKIDKWEVLAA